MMKQHRSASWSALFVFPFMALVGQSNQAALQLNNEPGIQQSTPSPERDKASTEAIAEAEQLSRTVVKLFSDGNYDKALPLAKRALELRETALGPDHELVQGALLNLAEIDSALKKYGEAQKLFERLLKTHEKKVGLEDADAAFYLEKLAFLAYLQLDFNKSEAAYKRALAIREKAGKDQGEFATSLYLLAELYRFTGKVDKAEPLYEQAAILRGKLLGHEHPDYVKARDRYFCVAYETHQLDKLKDFAAKLGERPQSDKAGTVEGAILNGRAIYLPKPSYSEAARRERAQGTVVIKVTIDELGRVIEAADMCGGNPLLVKPSLQSAREARFTPTKLSGQPVKVSGVITYRFVRM